LQGASQLTACWARIRGRLRDEVGDVEYRTWLRQMTLAGVEGDEAIVQLPTRFLRDWVRGHYEGHVMNSSGYTGLRLNRNRALIGLAAVGAAVALLNRVGVFGHGD